MTPTHFTLRDLKKMCRAAVEELCARHGYSKDQFKAADGDETVYAPPLLQKRFKRGGFATPATGTLLLWSRTSHEYDEWDCDLPTEMLAEIDCRSSPEEEAAMAAIIKEEEAKAANK